MKQTLSTLLLFLFISACTKEEPVPPPAPETKNLLSFSASESWLALYFKEEDTDGQGAPALTDNIQVFAFDTTGNILASAKVVAGQSVHLQQEGNFAGEQFHLGIGALSEQHGISGVLFGFVQRGQNWSLDTEHFEEPEVKAATVRLLNIPEGGDEADKPAYYLYSNYTKYPNSLQQEAAEATIEAINPSPLYLGWQEAQTAEQKFILLESANFESPNKIDVSAAASSWIFSEFSNPYSSKEGYRLYNFSISPVNKPAPAQKIELEDRYIRKPEADPASILLPVPQGVAHFGFSLELEGYFLVYEGSPSLKEILFVDLKMHALETKAGEFTRYHTSDNTDYHLAFFESGQAQPLSADFMAILPAGTHTFYFPKIYDVFEYQPALPPLESIRYVDSELISHDNIQGYEEFLEIYRSGDFEQVSRETGVYVNYWPGSAGAAGDRRKKQKAQGGSQLPFRK